MLSYGQTSSPDAPPLEWWWWFFTRDAVNGPDALANCANEARRIHEIEPHLRARRFLAGLFLFCVLSVFAGCCVYLVFFSTSDHWLAMTFVLFLLLFVLSIISAAWMNIPLRRRWIYQFVFMFLLAGALAGAAQGYSDEGNEVAAGLLATAAVGVFMGRWLWTHFGTRAVERVAEWVRERRKRRAAAILGETRTEIPSDEDS